MRTNDPADNQQFSLHPHNRLILHDTYPEHSSHDIYSAFFSAFSDPASGISTATYPYSLAVGGPADMSASLQQAMMQLDAADTSHLNIRGDLSEPYAPNIDVQPLPEQQCLPSVRQSSPNDLSFFQSNGIAYTMLPPMIQPNPDDPLMQFDSEVGVNISSSAPLTPMADAHI
jgi:hypothetical protein